MSTTSMATFITACFLLMICNFWINKRQAAPYMDELFHIPQAAEFCAAVQSHRIPGYNPAITTLPGLYLLPTLLCAITRTAFPVSTRVLRFCSLIYSLLCFPLICSILRNLRDRIGLPTRNPDKFFIIAFALWLHPVSLFYSHLFYTDAPAILYTLLCWLLALSGRQRSSALAGVAASLMRQTHLVWHLYIAIDVFFKDLAFSGDSLDQIFADASRVFFRFWPHVAAGILYVTFLFLNGGPAVGHREHHEMSLHYAMLPYFLGFHALSYAPFQLLTPVVLFRQLRIILREKKAIAMLLTACVGLAILVIATGDHVHPFILADNRHFTFYLYRKWLLRSSARRLFPLPLYAWGILSPCMDFRTQQQNIVLADTKKGKSSTIVRQKILLEQVGDLLLLCCAAATLVPSSLMEPRYFGIASMMLSIRRLGRTREVSSMLKLTVLCTFLVMVNLALVYVFAELPFMRPADPHMPHDLSPGRFMF